MTSVKTLFFFIFSLVVVSPAFAQEGLRELQYNSIQKYHHYKPNHSHAQQRATLPFIDDFSTSSVVPDQSKWIGKTVYINNTYPLNPPSIGVATFDGLDSIGLPFNLTGSTTTFPPENADMLTSVPIDLSSYSATDSVYLSFLYEPQGLGDFPNLGDSLILEFKSDTAAWQHQWSVNGFNASTGSSAFKWVMIPIIDSSLFTDNFQFRFRSKAAITGNNDHWHVDYVQLDENRAIDDTTLNDIAIQYPSPSLLKHYYEMPWNQFQANPSGETASETKIFAHNNYLIDKNATYGFNSMSMLNATVLNEPPVASFNFSAQSNQTLTLIPVDFTPVVSDTDAVIRTTYFTYLTGSTDELPANDTVIQYQRFRNYLAYDDGSAEKAYYISGTAAQGAISFHVNVQDSVQGIQIHWGRVDGPQINLLFSLFVRDSLEGTAIYQRDFLHPTYVDSINGYSTYVFDSGVVVSDTFFVGWLQSQNDGMDFGLDRNTDSHQNLWYNLSGGWQQSTIQGSLMIRPILGSGEGIYNTGIAEKSEPTWKSYPNPVTDWIRVAGVSNANHYKLIDLLGRTVSTGKIYNERIDLPGLSQGLYLLQVTSNNATKTFRIVKQ